VEHKLIDTGISWTFKSIASYLKFISVMFPSPLIIQSLNPYFVLHHSSVLTLISTALHKDFTAFVVMLTVLREIGLFGVCEICSHAIGHCYVMGNLCFVDAVLFLLLYSDAEY